MPLQPPKEPTREDELFGDLRRAVYTTLFRSHWSCIECNYGIYTHNLAGYRVIATEAPSRHRGGVALFYRTSSLFAVEAVRDYGPNVLSFEVATGGRRWYIIGCYLAPDDARTIERVVTALGDQPRGTALLVAGDFNT